MTKSMFAGMGVDLSEEMTQERLNELTQQFNALSYEQRAAITDPFISEAKPDRPVIGPVVLPTEEEVRESAAASPVLTGFKALCAYFEAPGRPLTAKGNIKLADAGALSTILGSEPLEEDFGRHTFRRHSSASMPSLDHWQWWARQTGAIRVAKGRMVEVKAWSRRCEQDPVGEATKAFEILMSHGVVGSYLRYGLSSGPEVIDNAVGSLLAMILASRDPLDFTTLVDAVLRVRKEMGVRPAFGDDEIDAEFVSSDVNLMLTMLGRAGVLVQHDAVFEKARLSERRTGGTVTLTPFGIRMAVGEARVAGMRVDTVDSPELLDATDFADMAMEQVVDVDAWFRLLVSWMGLPENGRPALTRLFDALDGDTLLVVLGMQTPDELVEDFAAVLDEALGTRPADDLLSAAAISWLSEHERLDPARVSPERMDLSRITVLCQVASNDPAAVAEMMGATRTREESLADVAVAVRLMPPRVEALLDAIGRNHPDKVVAKSARRENLRVRSRLANQRRG